MTVLGFSFVHGAILGAMAAGVIPVIIHLMMRTKPRRVVFPAMRFVMQTHTANVNKNRLKHIILLTMRILAMVLLAAALARPLMETSGGALSLSPTQPVSVVIVLDTSGSMAYRVGGRTRLEAGKALATRLLGDLPPGSEAALLWPDRGGADVPLSVDLKFVADQVAQLTDVPSGDPSKPGVFFRTAERSNMVALLEQAYATLEGASQPKREIYVINDRSSDSWPDLAAGRFADKADTTVFLLDVGANTNQDFMISRAAWESQVLSPRRGPVLEVTVQAGELTGTRVVELVMDEKMVGRQEVQIETKSAPASLWFKLPPMPAGLHTGQIRLADADDVPENNVRYLALEVGPLPQIILVEGPAGEERLTLGDFVEAVLAPPQAPERARVDLVRVRAGDFMIDGSISEAQLERAHAVVLADVGTLGRQQWDNLKNYVGGGGTLIVLTGANTSPRGLADSPSAQAILPVRGLGQVRQPAAGTATKFPDFDTAAVLETYALHDRKPLLDRELVLQYWPVAGDLPPETSVLLRLGERDRQPPLLLERPFDTGRTLMLLTSPQPTWSEWSQMGSATWPAMLFSMTMTYSRGIRGAYHFTLDEPAGVTAPSTYRAGSATVILPRDAGREFYSVNVSTGAVTLPTRQLGHYRVSLEATGGQERKLLYAVNFDPAEYRFAKKPMEDITVAFPPDLLLPVEDLDQLERGQAAARAGTQELAGLVALILLLLLIGESFFANRFYKRSPTSATAQAAPTGKGQSAGGGDARPGDSGTDAA